MTKIAVNSHLVVIVVQQILRISGMGIMAASAGKFLARFERILDPSHRVSFAIETSNDMDT